MNLRSINLQLKLVTASAVALAFAICIAAVFGVERDESRFVEFFKETLAPGKGNDYPLNRMPSKFPVCVYGDRMERTEKWTTLFFELLSEETWINPRLHYVKRTIDCARDTLLYVFYHQSDKNTLSTIVGDVSFILKRSGLPEFHFIYDNFGFGHVFYEKGKEPRAYVAVNEALDVETKSVDDSIARNVIQQELLQVVLVAPDRFVTTGPVSIIEERELPELAGTNTILTAEQMAARFELNVPNMCLYDIMLLKTIYANDPAIIDGRLGTYLSYIHAHYDDLVLSALRIQSDPRYQDLFKKKC
ncbi:hypothetical protein [Brucella anthropi]|uniref:hypothetical protein n=1 Tax=Brucella anthropi TaxID=529 RepID=UPI000F67EC1F|nr:hypothetical protein [Brucella anthropi]